jgi:oligopeptide transport system permease protein
MRLAPGGPFDEEQPIPPEIKANLQAAYGLDQPMLVQYGRYLQGSLRGDLGTSFKYKDYRVAELIARGLPVTVTDRRAGIAAGGGARRAARHAAALRHDGPVDHAVMGVALVGIAVPGFVLAPVLALVFGVKLGWLPVGRMGAGQRALTWCCP